MIPDDLKPLMSSFLEDIKLLMKRLETGTVTAVQWKKLFKELIARYHIAAMFVGQHDIGFLPGMEKRIIDMVEFQYGFLDGFAEVVSTTPDYNPAWLARANLYAGATKVAYWEGAVVREVGRHIPLPAMPAQGTTCLGNCGCEWRFVWVNKENGDLDAYWDRTKEPDVACQVCLQREEDWGETEKYGKNPVKIRNWRLVREKHLQGKHNQLMHGYRFAKAPDLSKARQYREEGIGRDYSKRARARQGRGGRARVQERALVKLYDRKVARARGEYAEKVAEVASAKRDVKEAIKRRDKAFRDTEKLKKELLNLSPDSDMGEAEALRQRFLKSENLVTALDREVFIKSMDSGAAERSLRKSGEDYANTLNYRQRQAVLNSKMEEGEVVRSKMVNTVDAKRVSRDSNEIMKEFAGASPEKRAELLNELRENSQTAGKNLPSELRSRLYQDPGEIGHHYAGTYKKNQDMWGDGISEAQKFIGKNQILANADIEIKGRRGNYRANGTGEEINIAQFNKQGVLIHELGHAIEDLDPLIGRMSQDFLTMRTRGEQPQKMSSVTGNRNYRNNEVTWLDKFINPYMGKIYKQGGKFYASEILSMGLQMFYEDPLKLARLDPEYFNFIFAVVRVGL